MTALIDLVPGVRHSGPRDHEWEAGWEHIEDTAPAPFSCPSLANAAGWTAARYVIRAGLALGLIERISPWHSKPVLYRIARAAMPATHPGGPTHPTPTHPPTPSVPGPAKSAAA